MRWMDMWQWESGGIQSACKLHSGVDTSTRMSARCLLHHRRYDREAIDKMLRMLAGVDMHKGMTREERIRAREELKVRRGRRLCASAAKGPRVFGLRRVVGDWGQGVKCDRGRGSETRLRSWIH